MLKVSLLDELGKGGFEASLITTFNAYLPFYEDVVLRRLVNAGIRHNVLMMDHRQYTGALQSYPPRIAGRHYTLVPVSVPGAFHPKLIFLVGKSKGLVVIGSHNLTLAGFGYNRELTNVIRVQGAVDEPGCALAAQVWSEVEHWVGMAAGALPDHVVRMVHRVGEFAPWLRSPPSDPGAELRVLGGRPGAEPLWSRLRSLIGGRTKDVIVSGAFYDSRLQFVDRLAQDLSPERIYLAVESETVELPVRARHIPNVSVVRADGLGVEQQTDREESGGYLHAKGLLVLPEEGEPVFASGSANPSAPAWLATPEAGNVELVLARVGQTAVEVAKDLGFADVPGMPALDDNDWEDVRRNISGDIEDHTPAIRTGIAVAEAGAISINAEIVAGLDADHLCLLSSERDELSQVAAFAREGDRLVVELSPEAAAQAGFLLFVAGDRVLAEFLIHHTSAIEEHARSGVQRRFREALDSLETDAPDIALLIDCIDKIIFSDAAGERETVPKVMPARMTPSGAGEDNRGTLAIDVAETKKTKSKQRLLHTSDFAYLLDALIYHLHLQDDKTIEELDSYGRSEEEQVGADDAEDGASEQHVERRQVQLLEICHAKVRTLINRMVGQLSAYRDGKQSLDKIVVRLLAVLAVLRQLRGCDARVPWVEKGKTTVPRNERARLFREVMLALFEGKTSLLHLEGLGEAFSDSDDIARLKGLLLWLAWDCGARVRIEKPFMESDEELHERLFDNAMLLALVQAVHGDHVVVEEARQSIGGLATGDLDWVGQILALEMRVEAIKQGVASIEFVQEPQPGDVAVHKSIKGWDLRVVANQGGSYVGLVRLSPNRERMSFLPDHLKVLPVAALWPIPNR